MTPMKTETQIDNKKKETYIQMNRSIDRIRYLEMDGETDSQTLVSQTEIERGKKRDTDRKEKEKAKERQRNRKTVNI